MQGLLSADSKSAESSFIKLLIYCTYFPCLKLILWCSYLILYVISKSYLLKSSKFFRLFRCFKIQMKLYFIYFLTDFRTRIETNWSLVHAVDFTIRQ